MDPASMEDAVLLPFLPVLQEFPQTRLPMGE
jgi:hypothetical protein